VGRRGCIGNLLGLNGAGLLLRLVNDPASDLPNQLFDRVIWGAWPTIGAVIVARQPRNRIGWLCCGVGFLLGPAFLGQDYAWYALVHRPGSLPGGLAMGWLGSWPWFIALGLILVFVPLLFPDGHLVSPRWRPVAWTAAAWLTLIWVGAAFSPGPLEGAGAKTVPNPLGIEGAEAAFNLLEAIGGLGLGLLMLVSVGSMVVRFRRARGVERQQLKWFTYAAVLSVLLFLVFILTGLDTRAPSLLGYVIAALWLMAVPVAIGVAVLRYHLFDIDRLINRTLVYGLLTAMLAVVYAAVVLALGQLFGGIGTEPPSWAVAGATLAVAALVQPARRRIQQAVDRRFNRRKFNAARTVEAFAVWLRNEVDLDSLSAELLVVVDNTMQPTSVSLWLRPSAQAPSRPRGRAP
jgi:MFS family permease